MWPLFVLLLISIGANIYLVIRVLLPLRQLAHRASRLAEGDFSSVQTPLHSVSDIHALQHLINGLVGHVRRAQSENRVYAQALTAGQEAERARIAHELHDDTIQALIAIGQSIDLAQNWLERDTDGAADMLKNARTQANEAVEGLRNLIADLRPPALEELGLVPALRMLSKRSPGIKLSVEIEGSERRLDAAYELTLFRSAQEALLNAQRHGHAGEVNIRVIYQPTEMHMVVQDNGQGLTSPLDVNRLASNGHYGLLGIQERIQQLSGKFILTSTPRAGVRLEISIPTQLIEQPPDVVRDPVCSALIQPHQAYGSIVYGGHRYYFCCPVCQGSFQRDPNLYLRPETN